LERSLIRERVKAGLRNAKAKGKHVGRPKVVLDGSHIARLRTQGLSWLKIAEKLGVGEGTVRRAALTSAKTPSNSLRAND
jgi:DNA invertase Pin-like site-specific DNA recombinase